MNTNDPSNGEKAATHQGAKDNPCDMNAMRKRDWFADAWRTCLAVATLLSGLVVCAQSPVTLTFENLPDDWTNTYGGLHWTNCLVLNAVYYTNNPSGYSNGMVSPAHVAFNGYTRPVEINRSNGAFNLVSANLAGAWRDRLEVQVQGFTGGALRYDNIFVVEATQPTLVTFNYQSVDQVIFSSFGGTNHGLPYRGFGTHFVMDDMTVSIPPAPTNVALNITLTTTNFVVLRWVDWSRQFSLCKSRNLDATNWEGVANVPGFDEGTNVLLLPVPQDAEFYKLLR